MSILPLWGPCLSFFLSNREYGYRCSRPSFAGFCCLFNTTVFRCPDDLSLCRLEAQPLSFSSPTSQNSLAFQPLLSLLSPTPFEGPSLSQTRLVHWEVCLLAKHTNFVSTRQHPRNSALILDKGLPARRLGHHTFFSLVTWIHHSYVELVSLTTYLPPLVPAPGRAQSAVYFGAPCSRF